MITLEKELQNNIKLHKLVILSIFYREHYKNFTNDYAELARREAKNLYLTNKIMFNKHYEWAWDCLKERLM